MFDVQKIRKQFPILNSKLIYFDNAATTQKPKEVIESINTFYESQNSNVHRGMYPLAITATSLWEKAHETVAKFLGATSEEIFFTQGTTSGFNWIAQTLEKQILKKGDVVAITQLEHHSNIIPWKFVNERNGVLIEEIPFKKDFSLDLEYLKFLYRKYGERVKVVSLTQMSNVLGVLNDVVKVASIAHEYNSIVIVDGAQGIAHEKTNVVDMDCDIYIFSGHKIYGPMGIGAVFVKKDLMEKLYPVYGGGDMLDSYSQGKLVLKPIPYRFEAGTPNVEGGVALAKALEWLSKYEDRLVYEDEVRDYAYEQISKMSQIKMISPKEAKGLITFTSDKVHPHDIASDLGEKNICVRAGVHCAQPLHERLDIQASLRASFGIYNTKEEVDIFIQALKEILSNY